MVGNFSHVRFLVRWMAGENVRCFKDLDQDAVDRFVAMLRARPGRNASRLSLSTAEGYLGTIRTFHMQRDKLDDAPLMAPRSEEHTSELQSLMRISYAVFCLQKKTDKHTPCSQLETV